MTEQIEHNTLDILDRSVQLHMLRTCAKFYPHSHIDNWTELADDETTLKVNLMYLQEHGLLKTESKLTTDGGWYYTSTKITNNGLDFIKQDGGLSAILGVVTIRLHDDTIKELIALRISQSDLSPQDKRRYIDQLRELPAESTKHAVMKLVELGLDKAGSAMSSIGTLLGL